MRVQSERLKAQFDVSRGSFAIPVGVNGRERHGKTEEQLRYTNPEPCYTITEKLICKSLVQLLNVMYLETLEAREPAQGVISKVKSQKSKSLISELLSFFQC